MFRLPTSRTKAVVIAGALAALTLVGPMQADAGSRLQNRAMAAPATAPSAGYPAPGVETWLGKRFPPPAPTGGNLAANRGGQGGTQAAHYPTCNPLLPGTCTQLRKVCKKLKGGMSTNPDGSETCAIYDD